jgi:hypothetical protein
MTDYIVTLSHTLFETRNSFLSQSKSYDDFEIRSNLKNMAFAGAGRLLMLGCCIIDPSLVPDMQCLYSSQTHISTHSNLQ